MNKQDYLFCQSARQSVYKGFSECFYLPQNSLYQSIGELIISLDVLESEASSLLKKIHSEPENEKKLIIDFSKLFIGPYSLLAPPYGSVYLEGDRKIMGDSTLNVIEHYKEAGLAINDDSYEVPDHICVELEFMYFLIFKEIEAIQSKQTDVANQFMNRQPRFFQSHISDWVFQFIQLVENHAETDFYHNLAAALGIFITEEVFEMNLLETAV